MPKPPPTGRVEELAQKIESANTLTVRPPDDVKRMLAKAIRDAGQTPSFWFFECLRSGLAKYAGKKDNAPSEYFIRNTR